MIDAVNVLWLQDR